MQTKKKSKFSYRPNRSNTTTCLDKRRPWWTKRQHHYRLEEEIQIERQNEIVEESPKPIVTVNLSRKGPLIPGNIERRPATLFLDTGSAVNLISLEILNKVQKGVKLLEPIPFVLQGVTGNSLNTIGKTELTITIGGFLNYDITVIVVEESSFPGDLLIGFTTMRDAEVTISPAECGARLSYKFIPFLSPEVIPGYAHSIPLTSSEENNYTCNDNYLNNVAERSDKSDSITTNTTETEEINYKTNSFTNDEFKYTPEDAPDESLLIVSGSVIESTLLRAMSINKGKVKLTGIRRDAPVITLTETSRVKGIDMEAAIYNSSKGELEIFLTNKVNKNVTLKKGTQIGLFQICESLEVINDENDGTKNESTLHNINEENASSVCSVQEDWDLIEKLQIHLKPTSRSDLEPELML